MENALFKSAGFGGFNRKDVIEFIEARAREHADVLDRCRLETKEARETAEALSKKLAAAERQLEDLREERNALAAKLEEQNARAVEKATMAERLALELKEEKALRNKQMETEKASIKANLEAEKNAQIARLKSEGSVLTGKLEAEKKALLEQLDALREAAAAEREAVQTAMEAEKSALAEKLEAEKNALIEKLKTENAMLTEKLESEKAKTIDQANTQPISESQETEELKEALDNCREEKDALERRLKSLEPMVSSYETIKNRLAEIEFSAYCRAERIEEDAAENAAEIRGKAEQALGNLRCEYETVLTNMNASCAYVIERLAKVQESLNGLDASFEKTGKSLTDLSAHLSKEAQTPSPLLPEEQTFLEEEAEPCEQEDLPQGNEVPFPENEL